MNSPPKEKAASGRLGGLGKTVPGGIGDADSTVETATPQEQPEHRNDRRRFLIWALMAGYTTPERVVERIVGEIERAS